MFFCLLCWAYKDGKGTIKTIEPIRSFRDNRVDMAVFLPLLAHPIHVSVAVVAGSAGGRFHWDLEDGLEPLSEIGLGYFPLNGEDFTGSFCKGFCEFLQLFIHFCNSFHFLSHSLLCNFALPNFFHNLFFLFFPTTRLPIDKPPHLLFSHS